GGPFRPPRRGLGQWCRFVPDRSRRDGECRQKLQRNPASLLSRNNGGEQLDTTKTQRHKGTAAREQSIFDRASLCLCVAVPLWCHRLTLFASPTAASERITYQPMSTCHQ